MTMRPSWLLAFLLLAARFSSASAQTDPLPSWNDGPAKQAIVSFVSDVTREGSSNLIAVPERIATFDNDGTLWIEQPTYVQFALALARVREVAPLHPEWSATRPFEAIRGPTVPATSSTERPRRKP